MIASKANRRLWSGSGTVTLAKRLPLAILLIGLGPAVAFAQGDVGARWPGLNRTPATQRTVAAKAAAQRGVAPSDAAYAFADSAAPRTVATKHPRVSPPVPPAGPDTGSPKPLPQGAVPVIAGGDPQTKVHAFIADILEPEVELQLDPEKSKLVRTRQPVTRFSVTNPEALEVVQFSPTEFELIGLRPGKTTLTLWFGEQQYLRYLVNVERDKAPEDRMKVEYGVLQNKINELFPNSMVQLIPISDKLIVRGQARDGEEAAQIISVITGQGTDQTGQQLGPGSGRLVNLGSAAKLPGAADLPATDVISLLDVPGEQQIMLKVRVAELSRAALRKMGVDLTATAGDFAWTSMFGITDAFSAVLNTEDVTLALTAISSNSYSKILAEPNLVTLNGQSANFFAGGEFAVPTVVGVEGVSAVSTGFRGFGTQLAFTPTIVDKDRIRLIVMPSFSTLNQDIAVDGIPGLNSRAVSTTVELREGQWLAIGGLLQDQQSGNKVRVPFLGDIPVVGTLFSRRETKREETELIVLVSPELVHPMEARETPLILPGMEVTEPGDWAFFLGGRYEGNPKCDHRSTVWPIYQNQVVDAKMEAIAGAKGQKKYQHCEKYYLYGPDGLSR
jgi:pilus assembly protein CpaC